MLGRLGWRTCGIFLEKYVENREYYVYAHYKPNEVNPFYVGIGVLNRAWDTTNRSTLWKRTVKKYGYEVRILISNISKLSAIIIEEQLIREYGRLDMKTGTLVNHTAGGDGCVGHSEHVRKLISEQNKQRWEDPEYRAKMLEVRKRQKIKNPDLTSERKSLALTGGKVYTLEGPDKKLYECINQAKFAREHGLIHTVLSAFLKGKYKNGVQTYNGWRVVNVKTIETGKQHHWSEDISIFSDE